MKGFRVMTDRFARFMTATVQPEAAHTTRPR
jgi:hypothetical protein